MKKPSTSRIQAPKKVKGKARSPVMSNSTDELEIDLRPSYTSTEAAVQILCWLHGVKRRKYIPIDPNVLLKQHPCLDELKLSVRPLIKLYTYAMLKEQDAIRYGESTEAIQKLHEENDYYLKLTNLHSCYQKDIGNELMMESGSTLKFIDKDKDLYVERFELHKWICRTYNVKLINSSHSYPPSDASPVGKFEVTKVAVTSNSDTNEIEDEKRDAKGGLGKKGVDSLYTTLAFLVEAFVELGTKSRVGNKYRKSKDGRPNVSAIAHHLTALAAKSQPNGQFDGQRYEAIRTRISDAIKIKSDIIKNG